MWLLGGGGDRQAISNFLEPQLRELEIDGVVSYLLAGNDPTGNEQRAAAEVCLALWDCLSDQTANLALDRLSPEEPRFPLSRDIADLWTTLGNRLFPGWDRRFLGVDRRARAAIAAGLIPEAIAGMDEKVVAAIEDVLDEMPTDHANPWLVRAAVSARLGGENPIRDASSIPVDQLVDIAGAFREWVSDDDLTRAADRLVGAVEDSIADARSGSFGIGGQPEALLGRIIQLLGKRGLGYSAILLRVISDSALSGTSRLAALASLAIVAGEFGVDDETAEAIRQSPVEAPSLPFMDVDQSVLLAAKLLALHAQLSDEDVAMVFSLARSNDARARQIAVNAAGLSYRRGGQPTLGHVLVGALFDPAPVVVEWGLQELLRGVPEELALTVENRLPTLGAHFPRGVRARAVTVARAMANGTSTGRLREIVARGQQDKSWQVRKAANQE
jgi:hypothetical protein